MRLTHYPRFREISNVNHIPSKYCTVERPIMSNVPLFSDSIQQRSNKKGAAVADQYPEFHI